MRLATDRQLEKKFPWTNAGYFRTKMGEGWLPILTSGFDEIEKTVGKKFVSEQCFSVLNIGNKNGHLDIYSVNGNADTERIISQMIEKSKTVCESCGKPAEENQVLTFCPECRKI